MQDNSFRKNILYVALVVIAIWILIKFAGAIYYGLAIIVLSLMFGTILDAPVSFLKKYRIPRIVGTFYCIFVIFGLFADMFIFVAPKATPEFKNLLTKVPQIADSWDDSLSDYFNSFGLDNFLGTSYDGLKNSGLVSLKENMAGIFGRAKDFGIYQLENMGFFVIGFLLTLYVAIEPKTLIKGFLDPWNMEYKKKIRRCLLRIQKMLFCWALGLLVGCFCIFLLTWIGLSVVRFPFAFFFAVFAGFLNIIPTLGPFVAAFLPCVLMLVLDPKMVIYVIVVYGIIQQLESNFITPLIMKKQLDLHPFVLIASICIMGYFFGVLGCFITAPILASIKIIYDEFYSFPKKNKNL